MLTLQLWKYTYALLPKENMWSLSNRKINLIIFVRVLFFIYKLYLSQILISRHEKERRLDI